MRGLARIEGGGGRVRPGARGFPSDGGGLARRSASNPTPLEVAGTQMFSGEGVSAPFLENLAHRRTTDSELARSRGIRLSN